MRNKYAIIFSFLVTAVLSFNFWNRPPNARILARCPNGFSENLDLTVKTTGGNKIHISESIANPGKSAFFLPLQINFFSKIKSVKINCALESSLAKSNDSTFDLPFQNQNDQAEIDLTVLQTPPENLVVWLAGLFVLSVITFLLSKFIINNLTEQSILGKFYSLICGAFVIVAHFKFSPALISHANPIAVLENAYQGILLPFEGITYHALVSALLIFVPNVQLLSAVVSALVIALIIGLFRHLDRSIWCHLLFVFICLMPWLSPATVGFTQFVERGVIAAWLCMLVSVTYLLRSNKMSQENFVDPSDIKFFLFLLFLSLFKYEYLAFSAVICYFAFIKSKLRVVSTIGLVTLTMILSSLFENITPADKNWRDRYYIVSSFHYIQPLIRHKSLNDEKKSFIDNYYSTKNIEDGSGLWKSLNPNRKSEFNFQRLAEEISGPITENFWLILKSRFWYLYSCFFYSWTTTEPTIDNVSKTSYSFLKSSDFMQADPKIKQSLYNYVASESYILRYLVLLLLIPFLGLSVSSGTWVVCAALFTKLFFITWLIPGSHLAYVFDLYALSFPIFLCFLKDFFTSGFLKKQTGLNRSTE